MMFLKPRRVPGCEIKEANMSSSSANAQNAQATGGTENEVGERQATSDVRLPVSEYRYDRRSWRRTNRTRQISVRLTPEFDTHVREMCIRDGLLLVELIEHAIAAYEREHDAGKRHKGTHSFRLVSAVENPPEPSSAR